MVSETPPVDVSMLICAEGATSWGGAGRCAKLEYRGLVRLTG
jgi:hypothetical protein